MRAGRRAAAAAIALGLLAACSSDGDDSSGATPIPDFDAPVVDQADVVPDDVERALNAELEAFRRRSGRQIAVAVVETTGDRSLEDYSIDLAREWGVGDEDEDDGVVVLVAHDDRRLRIEVGRGVEGDLTDLEAGRIRDGMAELLGAGDVGAAIERGVGAVRVALGDEAAGDVAPLPAGSGEQGEESTELPGWAFVPILLLVLGLGAAGRRAGFGGRRGGWGGPIIWGGGLGGGFGGGGGMGGGFGGGGGGGFGGGGASGSW